ncbi:hypothetical protein WAI453_006766 [Rhynchosporium graminicola]
MAKSDPSRAGRVKAFKPKVITGCKTCKARRIKCDEAKPVCVPAASFPWQSQHLISDKQVMANASPSIQTFPCFTLLKSKLEQRSFSFFYQNTVPQLSSIVGSPSWKQLNRLLLQAAHHEPAQYVKALGYLTNPATDRNKLSTDVALIICILFVCFENLRGEYSTALSHINGGMKIIEKIVETSGMPVAPKFPDTLSPSSYQSPPSSTSSLSISQNPYVPLSSLSLVFIEFYVQASGLTSNRNHVRLTRKFDMPSSDYGFNIPAEFSSADEACLALDYIRTTGIRMSDTALRKQTSANLKERRVTLDQVHTFSSTRMKEWSRALGRFLTTNPDMENERSILMLKMHHTFMGINTAVGRIGLVPDECVFDSFITMFKRIVELCSKIIAAESNLERPRRIFCLDTGIITALFIVATKCRDGPTRWKAHEILISSDRQEGILNSILTARVAKRVIEIEETGLKQPVFAADLPGFRRLAGVEVDFGQDSKQATVRLLRRSPLAGPPAPQQSIEETWEL